MTTPVHAHGIWVGRCGSGKCRAVHIDFVDDEGNVIACGAIPVEEVRGFTENIRDCAYEIATEREEPRQ